MRNVEKYEIKYFMPPEPCLKWAQKDHIDRAPIWCSVDLRDGNQALITPMCLEEKLRFFDYLVQIGFKEIEVGFPASSDTEYEFLRTLIEQNRIPDDVTVQVLTQAREHIIKKTYEALKGVKQAIVHLYNSTSVAQREQVFKKDKQAIVDLAVEGARMVAQGAAETEGNFRFEYSPESFTGTEMDFAVTVCNAVLDVWKPTKENPVIINLPSTVQMSMPHVYASQVEYMSNHLNYRDNVILSVHPHNDRGSGVSDAEMGILAGAQRVEGTLFGNGERTGNTDLVTVGMNLFALGVDPGLDFSNMPEMIEVYESTTGMKVDARHPYSGELVFTAFSGSHQDAIAKGMKWRNHHTNSKWSVPYLLIDPKDVGRSYDGDVIRINSQSGKGGIGYLLQQKYGFDLPPKMRENFGYAIKGISDRKHKELAPNEVYEIFTKHYVNVNAPLGLIDYHFERNAQVEARIEVELDGEHRELLGQGNGRLDAVSNAIQSNLNLEFSDFQYQEHALERGSKSDAACYVGITGKNGQFVWGVGVDHDIMTASVKALVSAVNRLMTENQ